MTVQRVRLCGSLLLLLILTLPLTACPRTSSNVLLTRNLVYGSGYVLNARGDAYETKDLLFDLMEPKNSEEAQRPAVIMVHGGGFTGGSKEDEDLFLLADDLASAGYVCFLIEYRLVADQPPAPPPFDATELQRVAHAATVDIKAAIRHVRAFAVDYAVDPDRIGIIGSSAGAIAGIAAGISDQGSHTSDGDAFPVPAENNPGIDEAVMAIVDLWGTADQFLDEFDPSDPPIMVVHGLQDFTVGVSLLPAQNIVEQCEEHGIPYRYYPVLDAAHGAWEMEVDGMNLSELIYMFLQEYMV